MLRYQHLIGGQPHGSEHWLEVADPARGLAYAEVADGSAGDVHAARPEQRRFAAPFGAEEHARWAWTQPMTAAGLHGLMASRSYWLRADERIRSRMTANLDWYLHEHLGHAADAVLQVPYVTVAWWAAPVRGGRPR